jgi:phi13 family phage major tail protein
MLLTQKNIIHWRDKHMAQVGLKHIVYAKLTENTTASYGSGKLMGGAIKADIQIDNNTAFLYADNMLKESVTQFKSGKISINSDDLSYDVQADILGHTKGTVTTPSGTTMTANAADIAPYVGVGFYANTVSKGVTKYRAIWLQKVQFAEPKDTSETTGDKISFQTPTIDGTILCDVAGDWKQEGLFSTEADTITWLNTLAGIVAS